MATEGASGFIERLRYRYCQEVEEENTSYGSALNKSRGSFCAESLKIDHKEIEKALEKQLHSPLLSPRLGINVKASKANTRSAHKLSRNKSFLDPNSLDCHKRLNFGFCNSQNDLSYAIDPFPPSNHQRVLPPLNKANNARNNFCEYVNVPSGKHPVVNSNNKDPNLAAVVTLRAQSSAVCEPSEFDCDTSIDSSEEHQIVQRKKCFRNKPASIADQFATVRYQMYHPNNFQQNIKPNIQDQIERWLALGIRQTTLLKLLNEMKKNDPDSWGETHRK